MLRRFNVRTYGFLLNELDQVLVSDELIKGKFITKFPGGGVELGEGIAAALVREFQEECATKITILEHIYTTDFFLQSQWDSESQVISVYYLVACENWKLIPIGTKKFDFPVVQGVDAENRRWVAINSILKEEALVLPADRVAAGILDARFPRVGFKLPTKK